MIIFFVFAILFPVIPWTFTPPDQCPKINHTKDALHQRAQSSAQKLLEVEVAGRFADLALECVHREYPNKISHVLNTDEDARPPRLLTPIFHGCFDWHSAVHGHWLLIRLARLYPDTSFADKARVALAESFTREKVDGEIAYLTTPGRKAYERP